MSHDESGTILKRMNFYATKVANRPGIEPTGHPNVAVFAGSGTDDPTLWCGVATCIHHKAKHRPLVIPVLVSEIHKGESSTVAAMASTLAAKALGDQQFSYAIHKLHTDSIGAPVSFVAAVSVFDPSGEFVKVTWFAIRAVDVVQVLYSGEGQTAAFEAAEKFFKNHS